MACFTTIKLFKKFYSVTQYIKKNQLKKKNLHQVE